MKEFLEMVWEDLLENPGTWVLLVGVIAIRVVILLAVGYVIGHFVVKYW